MIRLPLDEPDSVSSASAFASLARAGAVSSDRRRPAGSAAVCSDAITHTVAPPPQRGDLMAYAVQMVLPLRREFDRAMDVTRFLGDASYAREILLLAKTSKDARLRAYATFLDLRLLGQALPERRSLPR